MAFRVRVIHSVLLGLIGLSFIVYSSYYVSPGQIYKNEPIYKLEAPIEGIFFLYIRFKYLGIKSTSQVWMNPMVQI